MTKSVKITIVVLNFTTGGMAVKKYIYCVAMAMLTMTLLTGCGVGIELSDEENDMIAEYMAAALLKYDAHYEETLIYAEAAETPEDEFIPVDFIEEKDDSQSDAMEEGVDSDKEDTVSEENTSSTLSEIFKSKKYNVSYLGVEEYETYKESGNDYFIVEAPTGCKLAVVQFTIANISDKDITVSLADKELTYELVLGENTIKKPLLTALMGDLQFYNETIPTGETKVGVVVFAVEKDVDVSTGTVVIQNGAGKACRISVK